MSSNIKKRVPKITEADKIIGERVKAVRKEKKVSQASLGKSVGVSHQQIQKYELGIDRIIASRLFKMANVLGVPITAFLYDDCPSENELLAMVWNDLPHGQVREGFISLMQSVGRLS